jgi:hypothetical protein
MHQFHELVPAHARVVEGAESVGYNWKMFCGDLTHGFSVVGSDIIGAEGDDKFGRILMDRCLSLQVLWKPAAPRLKQRFVLLRFMPVARGPESGIPASLEL